MAQTNSQLPTTVIPNSTIGTDWLNPNNILLADSSFAVSGGSTQIITVGNFPINLPQGSTVTNIIFAVKGYRGTFNTTLRIFAVDNTSGTDVSHELLPAFQGFDGTNTLYTLSATLFSTTWSVNQINNIKIKLIADGELHLDYVTLNVVYTPETTQTIYYTTLTGTFDIGDIVTGDTSGTTATIVSDDGSGQMDVTNVSGVFVVGETIEGVPSGATAVVTTNTTSGSTVIDEFVQSQPFQLAQSMVSTDLFMFLNSFNYPDGTPIQYADFHGDAMLTIDQGVPNKEENVKIVSVDQNYQGTGVTRLGFGTLSNRGLRFQYPYSSNSLLRQDHSGTAEIVITNNAPFYSRFLKTGQIDALVSAPVEIDNEGTPVTTSVHKINFIGSGVNAVLNGAHNVDVTISGGGSGSVDSVTSSDDIIDVDNTDPTNPILSLDIIELANNDTFIDELTNNSTFQTNVNTFVSAGGGTGGTKLAIDTDETSVSGTTTETTVFTIPIPGGTLGENNAIRFKLVGTLDTDSSTIRAKYGGSTVITVIENDNSANGMEFNGVIIADNSQSAQKSQGSIIPTGTTETADYTPSSVDSSISQDLVITIQNSSTGNTFVAQAIIVEKITDGTGSGTALQINQTLPIAWSGKNGDGDDFGQSPSNRQVMQDEATARIYVVLDGVINPDIPVVGTNTLRIFRNTFGSFEIEDTVSFVTTDLTHTNGNFFNVNWTKDSNFIYAVVGYEKNEFTGQFFAIDIIRFNLDGSDMVVTNAMDISGGPGQNSIVWDLGIAESAQGAVVTGSSLFTSFKDDGGTNQFLEYTISGTTYTLANTYATDFSSGNIVASKSLSYDSATSTFYIYSGGDNDNQPFGSINKLTIISDILTFDSQKTYPELGFYSIKYDNGDESGGYYIGDMVFQSSSMDMYMVYINANTSTVGSPHDPTESNSFVLTRIRYAKF